MSAAAMEVGIAIIGGGLGGLALAAGLRRRGLDAHVFEAAAVLRQETSTMIGLGPNAFTALGELHPDLPGEIRRRGVCAQQTVIRNEPPGEPPTIVERDGAALQMHTIRWGQTQGALAELVPPEAVHCSHPASGYEEVWAEAGQQQPGSGAGEAPASASASHALVHFRGQPSVRARLVVGADGVGSVIRAAMFPQDPGPRYLGHMNWNCLLYNPGGNTVAEAHKPGQINVASDVAAGGGLGSFKLLSYVIDAGGGYTFWQVRMQYDEPTFTAAQQQQQGTEEAEGAATTSRRSRGGLGVPGSKARVLERVKAAGWGWLLPVVAATPEASIFERALYDRVPLRRWASPGARVVLLGDAAHAMHPGPGQGARSAFEDAHQLALALEALWPDVPAALERYQRARIARATRVQNFSAEHSGLPHIRQALRPPDLSPADSMERMRAFTAWFNQYPLNMAGDPESKWWKPLEEQGQQQQQQEEEESSGGGGVRSTLQANGGGGGGSGSEVAAVVAAPAGSKAAGGAPAATAVMS